MIEHRDLHALVRPHGGCAADRQQIRRRYKGTKFRLVLALPNGKHGAKHTRADTAHETRGGWIEFQPAVLCASHELLDHRRFCRGPVVLIPRRMWRENDPRIDRYSIRSIPK